MFILKILQWNEFMSPFNHGAPHMLAPGDTFSSFIRLLIQLKRLKYVQITENRLKYTHFNKKLTGIYGTKHV